jgi:conserved hypothetical protein TIGR02300
LAKPEWGLKRTCFSCGARFYDLRRDPIICPICSTVFDPSRQPRPRRGSGARDEATPAPAMAGGDAAQRNLDEELMTDESGESEMEDMEEGNDGGEDGDIDEMSNEESEIIEDASELGEDDDDIGEVMEHVDDEMEDKA